MVQRYVVKVAAWLEILMGAIFVVALVMDSLAAVTSADTALSRSPTSRRIGFQPRLALHRFVVTGVEWVRVGLLVDLEKTFRRVKVFSKYATP